MLKIEQLKDRAEQKQAEAANSLAAGDYRQAVNDYTAASEVHGLAKHPELQAAIADGLATATAKLKELQDENAKAVAAAVDDDGGGAGGDGREADAREL
eukprot:SAG22_NODE_1285_length_4874_cov_2.729634_3_plen_99_part_00